MNLLFIFMIFIASFAQAEGPLFKFSDTSVQQEFQNVYKDIRKNSNYSKNSMVINVKDYGANGDNLTDDYASIQGALNYANTIHGGDVYLPCGKYLIGTQLIIYSSTTMQGENYGCVELKAKTGMTNKMIVNQAYAGTGTDNGIVFSNIVFDENGSNGDFPPTFARIDNSLWYRCIFKNGHNGLFLLTGSTYDDNHHDYFVETVFDSSNLVAGGTDITDLGNGKDIQVNRCTFLGGYPASGNVQISAAGITDFVIRDSWFDGQGNADPLGILGINGGGIYNNELFNSYEQGLKISRFTEGNPDADMLNFVVDGNRIHDNRTYGIWQRQETVSTDTPHNMIYTNNHVYNNKQNGFLIDVASAVFINHNFIYNNSLSGVGSYYAVQLINPGNDQFGITNVIVDTNIFYDTQTVVTQTKAFQLSYVNGFHSFNNQFQNISTTYTVNAGTTQNIYLADLDKRFYVGTFTRDISAASGSVAYSGVGFKPSAASFYTTITSTNAFSWGFDDGASPSCISLIGGGGTSDTFTGSQSIAAEPNGSNYTTGHITSFDADGFTISWTKTGTPTGTARVYYKVDR